MLEIYEYIQSHVSYAPYIIFGLLILAGFNLPVSEDAMLFISAYLAAKNPEYLIPLFAAVYLGAYLSDLICFFLGYFIGDKLWDIKWFASMVKKETVNKLHSFYEKYGFLTILVGRFIPFGVRNGLFLTAGIGKMNRLRFAFADLLAATLSCSSFFWIYYTYGESVIDIIKKGNIVLFACALSFLLFFYLKKKRSKSKALK